MSLPLRPAPSETGPPRRSRLPRFAAAALIAVTSGVVAVGFAGTADAAPVGAGSYTETLPPGAALPTGCGDLATNPRQFVTENAPAGGVPTNDWWSSLLFKKGDDCAFSQPLYAHPAAYRPVAGGLGVSYQTTPAISGSATGLGEYHYPYAQHLVVGVAGLNAPRALVDDWSDWTVSPLWNDGTRTLRATIGHGLPMAYFTATGGDALISVVGPPQIWANTGGRVGFSIGGHDYVAYGPAGSTWTLEGDNLRSSLAGKGYFSVAVLPTDGSGDRAALAESWAALAHNHVTGTKVSYTYDQAGGVVNTTYAYTTTAREGSGAGTVMALYPHQWRSLAGGTPLTPTYVSPRGRMKILTGTEFRTSMRYTGVLPEVPAVGDSSGADLATITQFLTNELSNPADFRGDDTYWTGKGLGRAARIAEIADQLDITNVRDAALSVIKARITDWFTATPGKANRVFYYDKNWGTVIGYPASYYSDLDLNDHHFHYGYFVAAAATLAKFDPAWASDSQYGGMVDLLIRDANNYDRDDTRFPYLRDFDIFAGHDWASGHGAFGAGNNQESSSEGQNFANALIQWGQATGNTAVRDAGIWIHTTQSAAIQEYWFDVTGENFPSQWGHNYAAIVWGSGGAYATWFSPEHAMIVGINMLPITGGQLYYGDNPAAVRATYEELVRNNGGEPTIWRDMHWQFLALGDPDAALAKFRANSSYTSEEGESKAHTFHWIRNLAALGLVDTTVTANHPLAKVFTKNGARTYVASNVSATALTVRFSDGTSLAVPAGKTVTSGALTWSGGNASGGVVVPDPTTPAPTTPAPTTPTPTPTTPGPTTPTPTPSTPAPTTPGPTTPTPTPTTPGPTTPPTCSPTGTLLSQDRPTTASSGQSRRAVDGNRGTRWTSGATDDQWLRVDLGASRTIGKVELDWHRNHGRGYRIETSADGVTWTTVHTTTDGTGGRELVDAAGTGRYVRFQGTARGTAAGYSLYEFRVYAGCPAPVVATRHLQADGALAAAAGPAGTVALTAAAGNQDGSPVNARVFTATGVSGTHTGAATRFDLGVDAGSNVGNGTQVRVSYDLTGDGTWERVETYRYFATDPVPGAERYTEAQGLSSGVGTLGDLVNGQVKVEVWNAIGSTGSTLAVGAGSTVTLPLR